YKKGDVPLIEPMFADSESGRDQMVSIEERIKDYTRTKETPAGNPRFLAMLININDKRAKLWGLYAKAQLDSDSEKAAKLSDEDREARVAALLNQAKMRQSKNLGALAPAAP